GGIDVSTGALPASAVREEIGDTTAPLFELQVSGWHGIAAEVRLANGSQPRWLVVVSRRDNFPDRAAKAAAYVAAPLISALSRLDVLGRQQDRAIRSAVLDDALDLQPGDDTHLVESRAAALGVDFSRDSQVLVASRVQGAAPAGGKDRAGAKDTAVMWADRLQRGLEELAIPHLMLSREDGSVWLVQADSSRIRSVLEGLLAKQPTMVVGLGRRIGHIAEAPASFHDASLAAQHLARSADQGRLLSYDEFDLGTLLLADVGTDRMSPWARDVLRPLESKPILLEALEAYFKNNFDIMATAKSMHVHHNTLRYRISRIEEALGQSLRNPATIASLHLALVASSATRRGEGRRRSRPLTPSRRDPSDVRGALPSHEDPTAHEAFIDLPPSFGVTGNLR
ncbi:MAG: PucR family transcriptional regulator, partial [Micromonosporaceae bacterium]